MVGFAPNYGDDIPLALLRVECASPCQASSSGAHRVLVYAVCVNTHQLKSVCCSTWSLSVLMRTHGQQKPLIQPLLVLLKNPGRSLKLLSTLHQLIIDHVGVFLTIIMAGIRVTCFSHVSIRALMSNWCTTQQQCC